MAADGIQLGSRRFRNVFNNLFRRFSVFWPIEIITECLFIGMAVAPRFRRFPTIRTRRLNGAYFSDHVFGRQCTGIALADFDLQRRVADVVGLL
jgi:hypothetical protein